MKSQNAVIVYPPSGPITQGTIFSCGVAENYANCQTYGVVITARCDAANDKVRTYNYLPVVRLDDWLHRDGRIILVETLKADTLGQMKNCLSQAGHSASILETEHPRDVLQTLFPDGDQGKKVTKARAQFQELVARHELAERGIASAPEDGVCVEVARVVPKARDFLLSELVRQRLAGYYFFKSVEPQDSDAGYVALVRETQNLPQMLARMLGEGLGAAQFAHAGDAEPNLRGRLCISHDDIAIPVGLVTSPTLEHLMQSFSTLFGRIGLEDPDPIYISGLWSRQPSIGEGT